MRQRLVGTFLLLCAPFAAANFDVITLGSKGGIQDGNLTAFMIKAQDDNHYVTADAGSLVSGIIEAADDALDDLKVPANSDLTKEGYILKELIKGYFISHAHLDHISGLIIASPDDSSKPIYALPSVQKVIKAHYFNWQAWPNFGDQGEGFALKKYPYTDVTVGQWQPVKDTSLQVMTLPLAHGGVESSAFIFKDRRGVVMAYLGDTGPDVVEKSDKLRMLWKTLAPFAKQGKLAGLITEASFSNETPDNQLYGHLTPKWLMHELNVLADLSGGKHSLQGLKVIVSHIKYGLKKGSTPEQTVMAQLKAANNLGVRFVVPEQGELTRLTTSRR